MVTAAPATETIHTTANHPWLTTDRGWVHAGDLRPGEQVVTLPGQAGNASSATATVTVAWVRVVPGAAEMDNLTVAKDHTYAVGASRAVVHNDNCTETWGQVKQLSNGQTPTQFRAQASKCDFCGQSFQPGQARIIEHAYPRDMARPQFTNQAKYNAFVADVDNLSVVCKSCNSIKGTKYPGNFRVLFEGRPSFQGGGYVQRLLARITTMAQRYGLRNPW